MFMHAMSLYFLCCIFFVCSVKLLKNLNKMALLQSYVDGIANSVDTDQTAPSASTLFAQTYMSKNLGSLR